MPIGNPQDPGSSPARTELAALSRRWNDAAESAFATVLDRPDHYQRTARMVGALVAALRAEATDASGLLAAWDRRTDLLDTVAAGDDLLTMAGLDPDATAGAAFALRYRELLAVFAAEDRLRALRTTTPENGWVVVEEAGYRPGDPFVPYRRVEVELATGRSILVTTQPDEEFSACLHRVDVATVDLTTGRLRPHEDASSTRELASEEEREAYVHDLKHPAGSDAPPATTR